MAFHCLFKTSNEFDKLQNKRDGNEVSSSTISASQNCSQCKAQKDHRHSEESSPVSSKHSWMSVS